MDSHEALCARLAALEAHTRRLRIGLIAVVVILIALALTPRSSAQAPGEPLRVRGVIVEDANGRPRIVLGTMDGRASIRGLGLRINDVNGVERFGLSLRENGSVGMGFDAPPGKGDDRNRERINIVADENGGAFIRFLDRRTSVAGRMSLDANNQVWLEFSDFMQKPTVSRFIGLAGDRTVRGTP